MVIVRGSVQHVVVVCDRGPGTAWLLHPCMVANLVRVLHLKKKSASSETAQVSIIT